MIQKNKLVVVCLCLNIVTLCCLSCALRSPEIDTLTKIVIFVIGTGSTVVSYYLYLKILEYAVRYQKAYESLKTGISFTSEK